MTVSNTDLIVIGAGPAGISAAVYALRGGFSVRVIGKGGGALAKTPLIENYYGFEEPVTGVELERRGIEQARRLGADICPDEVTGLGFGEAGGFTVEGRKGTYTSKAVVLASGASRQSLNLPGIRELEGRGVSYCAICDAFFYRGRNTAVIGAGAYALHEAKILEPPTASVTLLTNGQKPPANVPEGIHVDTRKLAAVEGEKKVTGVRFEDGKTMPMDGVFLAIGTAGSTDLARKIGALTKGNNIAVDEHMATNVPGLFAAGDCTGGLLQVVKAAYEGAEAGLSAVRFLRQSKQ